MNLLLHNTISFVPIFDIKLLVGQCAPAEVHSFFKIEFTFYSMKYSPQQLLRSYFHLPLLQND
jgi:hypothetical protein